MDKIPVFSCPEIKGHINFPTYDNSINFEMKIKFSPKFVFSLNFRYQFHPDFWRDNAVVVSAPKFFTCHVTVRAVDRGLEYKINHENKTVDGLLFGIWLLIINFEILRVA